MTAGQAAAGRQGGVFELDEDSALAELAQAWADGGYHGFCVLEHSGARSAAPARYSRAARRTGWTSRSGRTGKRCNERPGQCRDDVRVRYQRAEHGAGL